MSDEHEPAPMWPGSRDGRSATELSSSLHDLAVEAGQLPGADPQRPHCRNVIDFLAHVGVATTTQVIERCWRQQGIGGTRHALAILRSLRTQDLLRSVRLDPDRGRASPDVLALAMPLLRAYVGAGARDPMALDAAARNWKLQLTEMLLVRESQGWDLVSDPRDVASVLLPMRRRNPVYLPAATRRADFAQLADAVERMPERLSVLVHDTDAAIRFIAPAHPYARTSFCVGALFGMGFTRGLVFEMVGADPGEISRCRRAITEAMDWKRLPVIIHEVAPFRTRNVRRRENAAGQGNDNEASPTG